MSTGWFPGPVFAWHDRHEAAGAAAESDWKSAHLVDSACARQTRTAVAAHPIVNAARTVERIAGNVRRPGPIGIRPAVALSTSARPPGGS
jgi:hypothetical protein